MCQDAKRSTQRAHISRLTREHTLEKNRTSVLGKVAVGDLLDLMSWHDTFENTQVPSLSSAISAVVSFLEVTIYPCTWKDTKETVVFLLNVYFDNDHFSTKVIFGVLAILTSAKLQRHNSYLSDNICHSYSYWQQLQEKQKPCFLFKTNIFALVNVCSYRENFILQLLLLLICFAISIASFIENINA